MATLWQRLTGAPSEKRAAQPTVPTRADATVTADTSLTLTAVYRAVQIIATPISKMPIETYRYATGMDFRVENPVLVNKPDINSNRRDFLFQTVTSLALEGNAFWHKSFGSNGQVNNLTLLPASAAASIFSAAQKLDENDVPADDRYCAVSPAVYYNLIQATTVINRDWGGSGSYSDGKVLKVAGINIVPTNNLPSSNITTGVDAGSSTGFAGNFSTTVGVVWQKNAVGTVKLMDLSTEMDYQIQRQGTLLVAKYAMGHAPLNPICSIEIKTA